MQITNSNYQNLLLKIQNRIKETETKIIATVMRQKVVMAWQIGKEIDDHLLSNNKAGYGEELMKQIAKDTLIAEKTLYKMRGFYQAYPELPQDNENLNWSHYHMLSGVKKADERKKLENLIKENGWSTDRLLEEIKQSKSTRESESTQDEILLENPKPTSNKLRPVRGRLFTYPLVTLGSSDRKCIDLGFEIFKEIQTEIKPETTIVSSKTKSGDYSFEEIDAHGRRLNIYKAYLDRVVDGDTVKVILDLGFGIFHREILRLKGINAAESDTDAGKKSTKFLSEILNGRITTIPLNSNSLVQTGFLPKEGREVPFLIIKTIKIDIFGRYVCDIFFDENKNPNANPQEVADSGIYLNQLLLDAGVVQMISGDY